MANQSLQLTKDMHSWLQEHACRPSPAMSALCKTTMELENGEMLTSPVQLQFLAFLAHSIGAKNAIEVGVYTGASALAIAEVLPKDGIIVACDLTKDYCPIASPAWKDGGVFNKVDLRIGPAVETLTSLLDEGKANSFDFMYIDADKTNSKNYYELGLQLLSTGGIIAIDNMFYGGQVIDLETTDANTIATRELASFLVSDNRIDYSLLPIGDGLALARVL
ncbi:MAG TPA: SAM-dependent methyltransferase [Phycisphaerales bacterium]|jgi:caffeoyl-CoA O-methyltransferase|nr:SAM-dependent methyltransferase [Phycisphaerales bacterium]HIB51469.1 SAM-dependent methyltransferase [Phycisphaerales bacterium]HIN83517.1 SAM-dependent methyltransferase [Phycisphaerales bacterium]HIO20151.1 SAM-dependent methyltransferase [Phycisphaerales bacterium]